MPATDSRPSFSGTRTFVATLALLGVLAVGETGVLVWQLFGRRSSPLAAAPAHPAQATAPVPAVDSAQERAAAAEKSLLASLPKATPTPPPVPAKPVVTPQSQVAELIAMAKELRDRGDTGTAMARLRQAQGIYSSYAPIISEMAITYEKMGLTDKALEQWRRIYEMGERAGIYYAAAEAKMRALQLPDAPPQEAAAARPVLGGLTPDAPADRASVFTLGKVGTTDDTGTTQPARRLKLAVPIQAKPGSRVDPRDVVIQVFFYETLRDGSVVEANTNVTAITSSWIRRVNAADEVQPVDWSTAAPEVLEVSYAQPEADPKDPRTRERRNYFGYSVRVYYKGVLNAKFADPARLLGQFIPPSALPSSDLPQ